MHSAHTRAAFGAEVSNSGPRAKSGPLWEDVWPEKPNQMTINAGGVRADAGLDPRVSLEIWVESHV